MSIQRRKARNPGPAGENDAVWVTRLKDEKEETRGVVKKVITHDGYDAPAQLIVQTEDYGEVSTTRERVRVVTGADADLFRAVIGGDDD